MEFFYYGTNFVYYFYIYFKWISLHFNLKCKFRFVYTMSATNSATWFVQHFFLEKVFFFLIIVFYSCYWSTKVRVFFFLVFNRGWHWNDIQLLRWIIQQLVDSKNSRYQGKSQLNKNSENKKMGKKSETIEWAV